MNGLHGEVTLATGQNQNNQETLKEFYTERHARADQVAFEAQYVNTPALAAIFGSELKVLL